MNQKQEIYSVIKNITDFNSFKFNESDFTSKEKMFKSLSISPIVYNIKNNGGIFADDLHVFKNEMGKYVILPKRKTELQQFSKKEMSIVDMVIAKYGDLTAEQLSELTHEPGGLWDSTVTRNKLSFEAGKDQSDIAINLRDLLSGSSLLI